jgi:hypothetical protein
MINYTPAFLMCATAVVWICTVWQSHILIESFWVRLPHVAARELDSAIGRSVKNAVFPFRRRAAELFRGDEILLKLRKRFLLFATLSVLVPIGGFLGIGIFAIWPSK